MDVVATLYFLKYIEISFFLFCTLKQLELFKITLLDYLSSTHEAVEHGVLKFHWGHLYITSCSQTSTGLTFVEPLGLEPEQLLVIT